LGVSEVRVQRDILAAASGKLRCRDEDDVIALTLTAPAIDREQIGGSAAIEVIDPGAALGASATAKSRRSKGSPLDADRGSRSNAD
jgi:hypothetical protein